MAFSKNNENIVIGYKQVLKAAKSGICEKIVIAQDCSPKMLEAILVAAGETLVEYVPSMRELGRECGIDVSASCAAIIRM